ncbi:hypothetical protein VTJ04DRAFT_8386 [Mycothermus thermophilus]|uniref:uncharacterized protein n=1 Tax=Humicola insolens TaxID=85995 RepID=UPI003741EA0B
MSASDGDTLRDATVSSSQKPDKKHKRSKSDHAKKRPRDEDETAVSAETPRKSKKSKSQDGDGDENVAPSPSSALVGESPKKQKKKRRDDDTGDHRVEESNQTADERKRDRKKSSKNDKDKEQAGLSEAAEDQASKADRKSQAKKAKKERAKDGNHGSTPVDEAGDENNKKNKNYKSKEHEQRSTEVLEESLTAQRATTGLPNDPEFPFYTQTISLYVPFYPVGFDKPLTNVASQHLEPLLNHYSPTLRGVLLGYSNLNLSDRPVKASVIHPPSDQTPALLHSIDEYAVGFGWLTFDAQLFVPARGKWMEGVVQLQSEGHVGVVCWNRFNASIEAKRLPKGWRWVDLAKSGSRPKASSQTDEDQGENGSRDGEDSLDGEELQVVEQIHTTGYWVNEKGKRISGKLRFRIKNFDVGLAGDYGYLSIEGTCLDDEAEHALATQEREAERARRARQNPNGLLRPISRRVPEFSMTRFGRESQEEDDGQRTVLYKGSRPGTPDD